MLSILVIAAIASPGAFECFKILHDIKDPDCDGHRPGQEASCFLCAHGTFVAAEQTAAVIIPVPEQSSWLGPVDEIAQAPVWTVVDHPGRSPPPVS